MKPIWQKELKHKKDTVSKVVFLYCRKNHLSPRGELCEDCKALLTYAHKRAGHCPHIEKGTACRKCKTPCYSPDMKEKMRIVMGWGGPRMMLYHPVAAIRYLIKG